MYGVAIPPFIAVKPMGILCSGVHSIPSYEYSINSSMTVVVQGTHYCFSSTLNL